MAKRITKNGIIRQRLKQNMKALKILERTKRLDIRHQTKRVNKKAETIKAVGDAVSRALTPSTSAIAGSQAIQEVAYNQANKDIANLINPTKQTDTSNAEEESKNEFDYLIK